jgi:hypothetical protein
MIRFFSRHGALYSLFVSIALLEVCATACRVEYLLPEGDSHSSFGVQNFAAYTSFNPTGVRHSSTSVSLVPPWKVALSGYGGIHRRILPPNLASLGTQGAYQSVYTGIDFEPRMKIFLWEGESENDGSLQPLIIVSVDVVAVTPDFVESLIRRARLVYENKSIGWNNVFVVASHTHSGPAGLSKDELLQFFAGDTYSIDYAQFVQNLFETELRAAKSKLQPLSSVDIFDGEFDDLSGDRLSFLPRDKKNSLWEFRTPTAKSCFTVFGIHPTFHAQKDRTLSADLAGGIEKSLQNESGSQICAFLPGAVGNATHAVRPDESIEGFGNRFALAVRGVSKKTISSFSTIQFGGTPVTLPELSLNWKGCEQSNAMRYFVSLPILSRRARSGWMGYVRFQNSAFVFVPGEPLSDFSAHLEQAVRAADSTLHDVRIVGVAGGYLGYLMRDGAYSSQSLESCSALVTPDGTESMVSEFVRNTQNADK